MAQFKCREATLTNENWVREEIKNRLNSWDVVNVCQESPVFPLLSKGTEVRILLLFII